MNGKASDRVAVEKVPEHERETVREFLSDLITFSRAAGVVPDEQGITDFMNEWRELRGELKTNAS